MKDSITIIEALFLPMFAGALFGFIAAINAADSVQRTRKRTMSSIAWSSYIAVGGMLGAIFPIAHPVVYATASIILAAFQLLNQEGPQRRAAWNILAAVVAGLQLFSVIYNRGKGFKLMLLWAIPAVLPFIAGAVQTYRLNKAKTKNDKKEADAPKKSDRSPELTRTIALWAVVAIAALTLVVLIII